MGFVCKRAGWGLGGHLKTGHTWSLQNRPTERTQNKSIISRGGAAWGYTDGTWTEGTAPQGCDRSADSGAGIREGESLHSNSLSWPHESWRKSDKSRVRGGGALAVREVFFLTMPRRFSCANCEGRT
jgi:hypothetical protein